MATISLQIPAVGNPNTTEDPKIASNFTVLETLLNGNLDTENLAVALTQGLFTIRSVLVSTTLAIGDLAVCGPSVLATLPTPTSADQVVGVYAASNVTGATSCTVNAGSATIFWPGGNSSTLPLGLPDSYVLLRSLSTSAWILLGGGPDTGWVPVTGAVTTSGAVAPAVRNIGGHVIGRGAFTVNSSVAPGSAIASISPAVGWPAANADIVVFDENTNALFGWVVNSSGNLINGTATTGTSTVWSLTQAQYRLS
jgi:hypothetical protein